MHDPSPAPDSAPAPGSAKARPAQRRTLVAGAIGNVLEWYDFAIYGFFAATIGRQFFPRANEVDSLIAAFGVFAAGYLMRPIGGIVFGYVGDTYGRKATLILSTAAMAIPTFAIGLLPTAAQVGALAPALLVAFRLLQGLSRFPSSMRNATVTMHQKIKAPAPERASLYTCSPTSVADRPGSMGAESQ